MLSLSKHLLVWLRQAQTDILRQLFGICNSELHNFGFAIHLSALNQPN